MVFKGMRLLSDTANSLAIIRINSIFLRINAKTEAMQIKYIFGQKTTIRDSKTINKIQSKTYILKYCLTLSNAKISG